MKLRSVVTAFLALSCLVSCSPSYPMRSAAPTSSDAAINSTATTPLPYTASQVIAVFSSLGLPVHIKHSIENGLTFTDERLPSETEDCAGTILVLSDVAAAEKQYQHFKKDIHSQQKIYQNHTILLLLSGSFSKTQQSHYEQFFSLLGSFSDALPATASSTPKTTKEEARTPAPILTTPPASTSFSDGTYVIGSLMPAGEYAIVSSGSQCRVKVTDGHARKNVYYKQSFSSNTILTLSSKQVLTLEGGTAIPIADSTTLDTSNEGMFKVGVHLPPGSYTISLSSRNMVGFGVFQIMKDSRYQEDSILRADTFIEPFTLTLQQGQYIRLNGAILTPIKQ